MAIRAQKILPPKNRNMSINETVKEIKQSFRQMMDGAVAQSMRDKGVNYHLNWGATLPRLREMADEIGPDYDLAIALWKENVRECKILATMLMPADEILPEVVDIWMDQIPSLEIAEQLSFNLWQHLPYAPEKAYQWLASEREYDQYCGFHVLKCCPLCRTGPAIRAIGKKCLEKHQFRIFLNYYCPFLNNFS